MTPPDEGAPPAVAPAAPAAPPPAAPAAPSSPPVAFESTTAHADFRKGPDAAPSAAAAAGDDAKAKAAAAGATPAEAEKAKQEMIDAMLDGKPFQIPKGLQLPYMRGKEKVYRPVEEVLKNHISHADYQAGKERIARQQADIERRDREFTLREQLLEQRQKGLAAEEERLLKAAEADPDSEEATKYREHLRLLRENPEYRKMVERARAADARDLEDSVQAELAQFDQATDLTKDVASYIGTVCGHEKYKGLDPDELRQEYGQLLASGELRWPDPKDPDFDEKITETITRQVLRLADQRLVLKSRYTKPLEEELATERKAREAAEAALAAAGKNGVVQRQIDRSVSARAGAPAGGGPPAQGGKPKEPPKPFMGGTPEARDRQKAWVKGG